MSKEIKFINTLKRAENKNMKTIEISDEMYDSLVEISTLIKTQDNRCTASPYFFQVQTSKEVPTCEGCGEEIWVDNDGCELRNEKEIREYISEKIFENDESMLELTDEEALIKTEEIVDKMDSYDLYEYLENRKYDNWRKVNVTEIYQYENVFFTEKACREHIRINGHNLNKPRTYINYAFRNPEMELIINFLHGLTK